MQLLRLSTYALALTTINKQRKFLLLLAAIGVVSMFLPWMSVCMYGICSKGSNGFQFMRWFNGGVVFLCFIGVAVVSFSGDQRRNLDKILWILALVFGTIPTLKIYWMWERYIRIVGKSDLRIGMYLAAFAAIGILLSLLVSWLFQKPPESNKGVGNLQPDLNQRD